MGSNTAGKVNPARSPAPCAATMSVAGKRTRSSRVVRGNISGTVLEILEVKSREKCGAEASFRGSHHRQWAKCVNRSVLLFRVTAPQRDVILMILWRNQTWRKNCCAIRRKNRSQLCVEGKKGKKMQGISRNIRSLERVSKNNLMLISKKADARRCRKIKASCLRQIVEGQRAAALLLLCFSALPTRHLIVSARCPNKDVKT